MDIALLSKNGVKCAVFKNSDVQIVNSCQKIKLKGGIVKKGNHGLIRGKVNLKNFFVLSWAII